MNLLEGLQRLLGAGAPARGSNNRGIGGRRPGLSQMDRRFQQVNQSMPFAQHLQARPQQYEDEALVRGPQGLHPMNADVANFRQPMMQPNMQPQYEDAYTPDLALNQTYTQGNPQLSRASYTVQDGRGRGLQNDPLRRLLGF